MRPFTLIFMLASVVLIGFTACGGTDVAPTQTLTPNPGPQIALLFANGHSWNTIPSYMEVETAPFLESALAAAGYTTQSFHFTDDLGGGTPGGYAELVARLLTIHAEWIAGRADPTRVVVIAHSHGGVRAHSAIRATPGVPVRLLVDLDTSSNGWEIVHPGEGSAMGGEPKDAYTIDATITCDAHPGVGSQAGNSYDVEDVVFANVEEALEVRTGAVIPNPLELEAYDERWNARLDGSTDGLTCHHSGTSHTEPILPTGVTLPFVRDWILARLATD
jgi:hypothetical protein